MEQTIKSIEFVMENCEVVKLTLDKDLWFNTKCYGLNHSINTQHNVFWDNYYADLVEMKIDKDYLDKMVYTNDYQGQSLRPWERILYGDVTSICYNFEDGTSRQIHVPWKGFSDSHNKAFKLVEKKYKHIKLDFVMLVWDKQSIWDKIKFEIKHKFYWLYFYRMEMRKVYH